MKLTEELKTCNPTERSIIEKKLKKANLRQKAFSVFGGDFKLSKAVVHIESVAEVDYVLYSKTKSAILKGYKSLREKLAKNHLKQDWDDLTNDERELLRIVIRENISEAPLIK